MYTTCRLKWVDDDTEFVGTIKAFDYCGSYEFMYDEIPYAIDLQDIWDICNWYLDYCNKDMTEKELLDLIKEV